MKTIQTIILIAKVEWQLQVRSIAFWVGLAIILLYTLSQVIGTPFNLVFLMRSWISTRYDSLTWIGIVLIFLIPTSLLRDQRTLAFLWTKPVKGWIYALGKMIGACFTAISIGSAEIFVQFLARSSGLPTMAGQKLVIMLHSIMYWAIGIFLIISVYFLLTSLSETRTWAAFTLCIAFFIGIFSIKDAAHPLALIPFPAFLSDMVGNGPETPLLKGHMNLFLPIGGTIFFIGILAYLLINKDQLLHERINFVILGFCVLVTSIASGLSLVYYYMAWDKVSNPQDGVILVTDPLINDKPKNEIDAVRLIATINPDSGFIEGYIEFSFQKSQDQVILYVPAGLHILTANDCKGHEKEASSIRKNWVSVQGAEELCIEFEGKWLINRSRYLRSGKINPDILDLNAGLYAGEGFLFIMPTVKWFPIPTGTFEKGARYEYHLSLPDNFTLIGSPTPSLRKNGNFNEFIWSSQMESPFLSLAAGNYKTIPLSDGNVAWVMSEHKTATQETVNFFMGFLRPFEKLSEKNHQVYTIIETPVLRRPIVTEQLIFLPEWYFTERISPLLSHEYEQYENFVGPEEAYRREIYYTVRGWLQGHIEFDEPRYMSRVDNPNPEIIAFSIPDSFSGYSPFQEALIQYFTLQLVDQEFGTNRIDEAYQVAREKTDNRPSEKTIFFSDAFHSVFQTLDVLEKKIGRTNLNKLLFQFIEFHDGGSINMSLWELFINEATYGKN